MKDTGRWNNAVVQVRARKTATGGQGGGGERQETLFQLADGKESVWARFAPPSSGKEGKNTNGPLILDNRAILRICRVHAASDEDEVRSLYKTFPVTSRPSLLASTTYIHPYAHSSTPFFC